MKVRETTRAAILAVRGMGAREAQNRLEEMKAPKKVKKPVARKSQRRKKR